MGLFGPTRKSRAKAERLDADAKQYAASAREHRAEAARIRDEERKTRYLPEAGRGTAGFRETAARIADAHRREAAIRAAELRTPWWKR